MEALDGLGVVGAATVLTILETGTDTLAKSQNPLAIPGYGVLGYVLMRTLRTNPLGTQNLMWNAMTNLTDLVVGVFVFGETVSGTDVAAAILITTGIMLLANSNAK